MKRKNKNLEWLRGYRCHTLWTGKLRLGRIRLGESGQRGLYLCEAGTRNHQTTSLAKAKRWVLENAMLGLVQGALF